MSLLDALLLDPAPFNIWLAVRTDGIKGTGTGSDPFDGGTAAAFDAHLKEIGALFPTEKVAIHLGPGTFYTQGYADADAANSWQVKGGMSIRGSGIGVTTLKRANGAPGNRLNYVVGHSLDTPADFFEISDLTIDCNLSAADADAACGALRVMGNHARIRRVRAIDWGSRTDAVPGFVFALVLAYPPSQAGVRNAGLEDCIADAPWPAGTVTGTPTVKVFHAGSLEQPTAAEDYGIGPFIRNCYVRSSPAPAAVIFHGLSMDWCLGGVVEGNQIHDTTFGGPVLEQTSARDIIVRNNTYKNVQGGPRWDLGTLVPAEGLPLSDLVQTQAGSGIALATMDGVEHGLKKGDRVLVEPDEGFPTFAGIFVVLDVLTADTFTYRVPPGPGTAHGAGAIYKVMGVGRLVVEGNTIELATSPTGLQAIYVNDQNNGLGPDYAHGDAIIQNNRIRYLDGAAPVDATATALQAHASRT